MNPNKKDALDKIFELLGILDEESGIELRLIFDDFTDGSGYLENLGYDEKFNNGSDYYFNSVEGLINYLQGLVDLSNIKDTLEDLSQENLKKVKDFIISLTGKW